MVGKVLFTFLGAMALCFGFARDLFWRAQLPLAWAGFDPLRDGVCRAPIDPISVAIVMAFRGALMFTSPILLYFCGEYLLPAVNRAPKRATLGRLFLGLAFYFGGAWLAFRFLAPTMLSHMAEFEASSGAGDLWTIWDYFSFLSWLCIAVGFLCELPIILLLLNRIGVVAYRGLSRARPYVAIAALLLAAVVVPTPSPWLYLAFFAPVLVVYEASIWIVWLKEGRRS
jgi:sec-independent protein translocase protein TatC